MEIQIFLFLFFIFIIGILFLIQGPPYVPSDDESTEQIIRHIKKQKPHRVLDMGSGDGKIVITLAKAGYTVDGIELNPLLVLRSRKAIRNAGLEKKAHIYWGNFWSYDTTKYDLIVLYAIKHIMPHLEQKLKKELKPGSIIVSNYFLFPTLTPIEKSSRATVYKITGAKGRY